MAQKWYSYVMAQCTRVALARKKAGPVEIVPHRCGKCPACLAKRSQEWVYRMVAESKNHNDTVFVTLTYSPEYLASVGLPEHGKIPVRKKEVQDFLKRLRKNLSRRIRYFACGEYGEKSYRAHYHLILFGVSVSDASEINRCWQPRGFTKTVQANQATMAYVARYCTKKNFGDIRKDFIRTEGLTDEFQLQSNKPGIGYCAIDKGALIKDDDRGYTVWFEGKRVTAPRYLRDKLTSEIEKQIRAIKAQRERFASEDVDRTANELQAERNTEARRRMRCKL